MVGTAGGSLYEVAVEERDKKEKVVRQLYDRSDQREPFSAVEMEVSGTGSSLRYLILAATPTRLYVFNGGGSLEITFGRPPKITELPSGRQSRSASRTQTSSHPLP